MALEQRKFWGYYKTFHANFCSYTLRWTWKSLIKGFFFSMMHNLEGQKECYPNIYSTPWKRFAPCKKIVRF